MGIALFVTGKPSSVPPQGHVWVGVPQLVRHVGNGCALVQQMRRIGVPKVIEAVTVNAGVREHPMKHLPHLGQVKRASCLIREQPGDLIGPPVLQFEL